jgi:hypothetical protein
MAQITYQYRGIKAIPTKWFEGVAIEHRYESCWYDGSEVVNKKQVKQRIKELSMIVNDFGHKKYRNIQIN